MKKEKKIYDRPVACVVTVADRLPILAGSPPVQPGGGGSGSVIIVPPSEDEEDTELSGAKAFNGWLWESDED